MKIALITVVVLLSLTSFVAARVGGGDILYEAKKIGTVHFSHDNHVEAAGINCTECHPSLFGTKAMKIKAQAPHKKQGAACGTCHNGKKAFDLKKDCNACHVREVKK